MSLNRLGRTALAGCAALLLAASPALADDAPNGGDVLVQADAPAPVQPGGTTVLHLRVVNNGTAPTADPFDLVVEVEPGLLVTSPISPSSCHSLVSARKVQCSFRAGLAPGSTETVDIPVLAGPTPGVYGGFAHVGLPADPTPEDDTAAFQIVVQQN
jgi:hypothetical protein